jgi:hypothetical protein
MASPTFDATKHDVSIGGLGYMLPPDGRVVRQDAVPATSRAAQGEGRYDQFINDSFYAQATWAGGAGQARLVSTDSYLSGVCDSRWAGHLFPARKLVAAANNGGTASFMFHRDSTMYGFASGGDIEQFGSNTSFTGLSSLPRHQPVVDGNNYMYYVTTDNKLGKWTGSGSVTDITSTLGTGVTPYVVQPFHRYLWCLATRVYESSPTIVQSKATHGVGMLHTYAFNRRPVSGNLLVMSVVTNDNGGGSMEAVPDGWILAGTVSSSTALTTQMFYKGAEPNEPLGGSIRYSVSIIGVTTVTEWEGVDPAAILNVATQASATATTAIAPGSITTTEADTIVIMANGTRDTLTLSTTPATGYTEAIDKTLSVSSIFLNNEVSYKVLTSTGTETPSATSSVTADNVATVIAAFKGNTITADVTQFSMLYSADAGAVWNLAFSDMGTGIELPTAAHAAGGSLWFTTPRGLYQAGVEDEEFVGGHVKLNIFLRGKIDTFNYPSNSANVGLWITDWNGGLYYGVGQTVRSFPMGAAGQAEGRQVWPTEDWGTIGGNVGAVIAGEGGVYFGAGATLYCFNQRGFHPLATNATANIYNFLYWHDGKLYVKADPASAYNFVYPSLRPDIGATAATNFETSYWVSSQIDFEKVDVYKHLAQFQTFAEFSATSGSGTITLEYLSADTGAQPDRLGGGATSLTWTTIGTHSVTDGNVKTYNPTTIKAKSIFLRLSWTVGASGYAIPHSVVANGRAIMPPVKRLVIPLWLTSLAKNKQGALMYADTAAVWTALDEVKDLRNGENTFEVKLYEPDGGTSAYTVTAEQMDDSIIKSKKLNRAVAGDARLVVLQLPGTTVTETRP